MKRLLRIRVIYGSTRILVKIIRFNLPQRDDRFLEMNNPANIEAKVRVQRTEKSSVTGTDDNPRTDFWAKLYRVILVNSQIF